MTITINGTKAALAKHWTLKAESIRRSAESDSERSKARAIKEARASVLEQCAEELRSLSEPGGEET